jgi:hypothetical protein
MKINVYIVFFCLQISLYSFGQDCDSCEIFVPNTLTPDCDQFGCEFLKITSNCEINELELSIYNRWGERVFHSTDKQREFNSSEVNDGTYLWMLSGAFCETQKFKLNGYLNVIR